MEPSRTGNDDHVRVFENATDEQLRQLHAERQEGRDWLDSSVFAVLDERSTQDRTVIIQHLNVLFDEETEEPAGETTWIKWRIHFTDAYELLAYIMTTEEIVQRVLLKADQFTTEDGIFEMQEALRRFGYHGYDAFHQ